MWFAPVQRSSIPEPAGLEVGWLDGTQRERTIYRAEEQSDNPSSSAHSRPFNIQ
jgi:hypothetical protein